MPIIFENEPLMFVHGPPVFIREEVADEESTSVFMITGEDDQEVIAAQRAEILVENAGAMEPAEETDTTLLQEVKITPIVDPSVRRRIVYLEGSFQKEMYRPLQFDLGDEKVTGEIDRVDGDTVFIVLDGEEREVVSLDINTIEEIRWHGQPFAEI